MIIPVIIAIIIIVSGIFLFNSIIEVEKRQALENVQIEFVSIVLDEIGITGIELGISIDMYNPNDVTATLDKADYEIWFNDNKLGNGVIEQQTDIPPYTSREIKTDFKMGYSEVGETVLAALTEEEHKWRIKGVAHYDTILGTIDMPFDITR